MLTADNLTLIKGKRSIFTDLSIECPKGKITLLLGKSGAGKSSLLRCLGQLDQPSQGVVKYNREPLTNKSPQERLKILSFIAQSYPLFPHLTVLENCSQPLQVVCRESVEAANQKAREKLTQFGMENYLNAYPQQLSGGQQQRTALARALGCNPAYLLLDEPTSALDPCNTQNLIEIIQKLKKGGASFVIATQDMSFAKQLLEQAYFLEDGRVVDQYPSSMGMLDSFLHQT